MTYIKIQTTLWSTVLAVLLGWVGPLQALAEEALPTQRLGALALSLGMYRIQAEVARTPEERGIGLMGRRELPAQAGMLFVFEQPGVQCFWMKNTLIPLSIAFLDDDGRIVNLDEMQARSLDSHCSSRPVRFVLEMNRGWFTQRGFKVGDRVRGAPFGTAP